MSKFSVGICLFCVCIITENPETFTTIFHGKTETKNNDDLTSQNEKSVCNPGIFISLSWKKPPVKRGRGYQPGNCLTETKYEHFLFCTEPLPWNIVIKGVLWHPDFQLFYSNNENAYIYGSKSLKILKPWYLKERISLILDENSLISLISSYHPSTIYKNSKNIERTLFWWAKIKTQFCQKTSK